MVDKTSDTSIRTIFGPIVPLALLLFNLMWLGCTPRDKVIDVDVPDQELQKVNLRIRDFDADLSRLGAEPDMASIQKLASQYPGFFYVFTRSIIQAGDSASPGMPRILGGFIADPTLADVRKEIKLKLPDLEPENRALNDAFNRYHYFFPAKKIPEILYYCSGFNYQVSSFPGYLALSKEFYLGSSCRFYKLLQYPQYKVPYLDRPYLVSSALRGWLASEFEEPVPPSTMLAKLIEQGKIYFLLTAMLPDQHDTITFEFSGRQLAWCKKQEKEIWKFFIEKNLLFSTNQAEIAKYFNEAPFAPGMPKESPGKIGCWVGRRIVEEYMRKTGKDIPALAKQINPSDFLSASGYKPN